MIQLKLKGANAFQDALTTGQHYAASLRNADNVMAPVLMACAIAEMRERLTDEAMSVVAQLAGSSLGFRTDQQYPPAKLKDIVISAILNDVNIVGNEFNVVAGEFYIAKNGWKRKLKNAGFSRVDPSIGRPEDIREGSPNQKGTKKISAMFCASASCQKDGATFQVTATLTDEADYRIEVDGYGASLMDVQTQLRGKAEARILRKLWFYVADEPDCDTDEPEGSVIVIEADNTPPAVTAKTTTPPAGGSTEPDFVAEWKAIASRVGQDHPVIRLARLLASAKTLGTIEALSAEEQSLYASGAIQTREHDTFRRYVQHCSSLFPEL
jgi:hypothetical protein